MEYLFDAAKKQAHQLIFDSLHHHFGNAAAPENVEITVSRDPKIADLSCSIAFRLAKDLKKSPPEIAQIISKDVEKKLEGTYFSSIIPLNGYLNFLLSDKFYAALLTEANSAKKTYGKSEIGSGKKAIIEFSSPNIGKPMHIGHIRSTILGDSVSRLFRFCGYKTISSNYLCEAGLQTAKLLLSMQMFGKSQGKIETEKDLLSLYVKIHKEMEGNSDLEKQAQELVKKMELGDPETLLELAKIRKLSTKPFRKNYAVLGIDFDEEVFDSDYVQNGKTLVEEAIVSKIAFQDKMGEIVCDLEKVKLPNLIILRSNGTTLYSTRDLGLADRDYSKYHFDLRVYVTASEQNLHFQQVFAILKLLGKPYADKLSHIGFGLISLEEGKLSTREGRVLLLEDVINDSIALAKEEVMNKQDYSEKDALEIARIVGIAGLKYSILKISSEKDIKFSLRDAVKFDGNTAAYLQYMIVRAKKIIEKAKEEKSAIVPNSKPIPKSISKSNTAYAYNEEEKRLLFLISQFPQVVEHSCRQMIPYSICDYLFKLALSFTAFYDKSPVLKAESPEAKAARLKIISATLIVMQNGLKLLGIDVPRKM